LRFDSWYGALGAGKGPDGKLAGKAMFFYTRERNMKRKLKVWVMVIVAGVMMAGCGGGGADVHSTVNSVSTGQQLMDLKRALDAGAMTKSEYEQEREKILEKE
jgi:hypothetical protein